jgi:ERCC4-type nuclease
MIVVDSREKALIKLLKKTDLTVETKHLDIGDIVVTHEDHEIIIERKTISDLLSSIKDGRYKEQMMRLTSACSNSNHNIFYLIEGPFEKNVWKKISDSDRELVHTLMFSISYYHGFSLIRTQSIDESVQVLMSIFLKLKRDGERKPYYKCEEKELTEGKTDKNYCEIIKKKKSSNITPENINHIMLQQIPGVSLAISTSIFNTFGNIANLINEIQKDQACMKNMTIENNKGKTQKINKTTIKRIIEFLNPPISP